MGSLGECALSPSYQPMLLSIGTNGGKKKKGL